MLNEALFELYTNNGILKEIPSSINVNSPRTILQELTNANIKYTWETVRDERIDNIQSVIEVRVYLPNHILYGRHVYKTANASDAHLYAISNAIKLIVSNTSNNDTQQQEHTNTQPIPTQQIPVQQSQPLSQEDILNMVQQQNNTSNEKITTAEQFEKDTREEIPFDEMDMDLNELDNLLSGKAASKVYGTEQQQTQPQQPVGAFGFTQNQIKAINDFKARLNITNDTMLGNYINSWDNKLSKKEDLTPSNIDAFIEWTKSVGKAPC